MPRPSLLIVIAMSTSVATARAERTIAVTLGAGAANDSFSSYHYARSASDNRWGVGVDIDVSARVIDELAVGLHVGVSRSATTSACSGNTAYLDVTPVLIGATASYTLLDRIWIAPWVGVLDQQIRYSHSNGHSGGVCGYPDEDVERRFAFGIGVGTDLYKHGSDRVGVYAQIARARAVTRQVDTFPDDYDQDILLSLGIAYRYW